MNNITMFFVFVIVCVWSKTRVSSANPLFTSRRSQSRKVENWNEYFIDIGDDINSIVKEVNGPSWSPSKNKIDESKILKKVRFTHPYFDQSALNFQSQLTNLQNKRNILYCGSYFGYGFHEDGIKSSIEMIKSLND